MTGPGDRGAPVVEAKLSFSEVVELMNAVHHFQVFTGSAASTSAVLDSGLRAMVDAMAKAAIQHPEAAREYQEIARLGKGSKEELEQAMRTLEASAERAKRLPPPPEPKDDEERVRREEGWKRMARRPMTMVRERVDELRQQGYGDDGEPGYGEGI